MASIPFQTMKLLTPVLFVSLSLALVTMPLHAQATVAPPTAATAPKTETKDDIVELSPFTVNTSSDVGYVAENRSPAAA